MTDTVYEPIPSDFYSAADLAGKLDVSHDHILNLARKGQLPFRCVRVGVLWRFNKAEVDRWIAG